MCVSNGAPDKPKDKQLQEFWDILRNHNAVFYGDAGLQNAINGYLDSHSIKRPGTTDQQKRYTKDIEDNLINKPETATI